MSFTERVRALLSLRGLSINKMLKDLSLGSGTFATWEKNNRIPNGDVLVKIADYFNVSTDYLLGHFDSQDFEQSARSVFTNHLAQSAKEQLAAESQGEEKPTPGDGDGQGQNIIIIRGRDGSIQKRELSDSQAALFKQMLDNLKPIDDENI